MNEEVKYKKLVCMKQPDGQTPCFLFCFLCACVSVSIREIYACFYLSCFICLFIISRYSDAKRVIFNFCKREARLHSEGPASKKKCNEIMRAFQKWKESGYLRIWEVVQIKVAFFSVFLAFKILM